MKIKTYILEKEKILLSFTRKTGSLSIGALLKTLGYNKNNNDIILKRIGLEEYEDFKKVMIVRNPYKRIMSAYNDNLGYNVLYRTLDQKERRVLSKKDRRLVRRNPRLRIRKKNKSERELSFVDFVNKLCEIPDKFSNQHFRTQTFGFNDYKPEVFIKLEDMVGWDELGLPDLPHRHSSATKHVTEIPEELIEKINTRFNDDFEILGYEKL